MSSKNGSRPDNAASLREHIFAVADIPSEVMEVPEWGGITIEIRGMSGNARADFLTAATDDQGNLNFKRMYPEIIIATAHYPGTDEQVFRANDRDLLNTKSSMVLERLAMRAMELSGMTESARNKLGNDSSETEAESGTSTSS